MKVNIFIIINALLITLITIIFSIIVIDEFPLFALKIYLLPYILLLINNILLISITLILKKLNLFKKATYIASALLFFFIFQYSFFPFNPISKTSDLKNYKKFDIQVFDEAKQFFPENINDNEVIKYSYYYSYTYHSVYEIYLEIQLDNTKYNDYINEIILKHDNITPSKNKYDNTFYEYIIEENLSSSSLYGDMVKIAYSDSENIIIYEYMRLKRYIPADSIEFAYFERFNVTQADYLKK